MDNLQVTSDTARNCLAVLADADQPVVAADIAKMLHLAGSRETQRRRVRAIVKLLRDEASAKIVATLGGGYMITDDDAIWREYLEGKLIDAKRIIGRAAEKKRKVIADRKGQGFLFAPGAIGVGVV